MVSRLAIISAGMLVLLQVGCQTDLSRVSEIPTNDLEMLVEDQYATGKKAEEKHRVERQIAYSRGQMPLNLANNAPTIPLTLRDALMIAFQHSEVVRTVDGASALSRIAATQYDPMVLEEQARAEQARFDPTLTAGYTGTRLEEPPGAFFGPGIPINTRRDQGQFIASVAKPWMTGGTTSIGYLPPLAYLFYPQGTSGFNPQYSSTFAFDLKQPLLKGAGPSVNLAPIQIAQLTQNQSDLTVKQAMLGQVRSIEEAYWDLQASIAVLQSIESVLPLLEEAVRIEQLRFESELVTKGELARVELQLSQFLQQRVQAKTDVANKRYRLGNLMGLTPDEAMNFIPVDRPNQSYPRVDAEQAMHVALSTRPDLIRQQLAIKVSDLKMLVAGNQARPQLDLLARYEVNGLRQNLDDSLSDALAFQYPNATIGATFMMPLGLRASRAARRASELDYARNLAVMKQTIENVSFQLAEICREVDRAWSEYNIVSQRVQFSYDWLRVSSIRFASPPPGGAGPDWLVIQLNDYQQAVRAHVDAVTNTSQTLARYNSLLARYEEAQGTLLDKRNVQFSGAQLPPSTTPRTVPAAPPGSQFTPVPSPVAPRTAPDPFHSYRIPQPQSANPRAAPAERARRENPSPEIEPSRAPNGSTMPPASRQFSLPDAPEPIQGPSAASDSLPLGHASGG